MDSQQAKRRVSWLAIASAGMSGVGAAALVWVTVEMIRLGLVPQRAMTVGEALGRLILEGLALAGAPILLILTGGLCCVACAEINLHQTRLRGKHLALVFFLIELMAGTVFM